MQTLWGQSSTLYTGIASFDNQSFGLYGKRLVQYDTYSMGESGDGGGEGEKEPTP